MDRMETRRAAVRGVQRVLPTVHDNGRNSGPPVLARLVKRRIERRDRRTRLVVHDFRKRYHPDPAALHKAAVALANADRLRSAVRNIEDTDVTIAMKDAVERLVLVAAVIWIRVSSVASTEAADVTAH